MPSFHLFGKPFRFADYPKSLVSAAIVILGVLLGLILQKDLFENYLVSLFALGLLIPALLVIGIIALVARFRGKKVGAIITWSASTLSSTILAIFIFSLVWGKIDSWKNYSVRKYVERAVPLLDQIKAESGFYPSELSVVTFGEPPSLLRNYGEYTSDGKEFNFRYIDEPADWPGGEGPLVFSSTVRKWAKDTPAKAPQEASQTTTSPAAPGLNPPPGTP